MGEEKSRREKRKEARLEKRNQRHSSWVQHQKKTSQNVETHRDLKLLDSKIPTVHVWNPSVEEGKQIFQQQSKEPKRKLEPSRPAIGKKKTLKRKVKTKFEEYLEMEMNRGVVSAEEDLELERKLAKRLKVKGGKLRGVDDGMNSIFDEISSVFGSVSDDQVAEVEEKKMGDDVDEHFSRKKQKEKKKVTDEFAKVPEEVMGDIADGEPALGLITDDELIAANDQENAVNGFSAKTKRRRRKRKQVEALEEPHKDDIVAEATEVEQMDAADLVEKEAERNAPSSEVTVKYVAPHLRTRIGNESEECLQLRRRVRGLLNRLSESNVESITNEMSGIFRSAGRSIGCQIIGHEVLSSCSGGPRGNEQYAAVFAAFVAGMACLAGIDFSAKLIESLASTFEDQYRKEDSLSMRNIVLLLCYLCRFGVCSSDLMFDFLFTLSERLEELDVSTILTVLQCCGMKLRGDDPATMKDFILSVQNRVNALKSSTATTSDGRPRTDNKRMEFMLETICDIKNNKKRQKEDPAHHTRIKKWLQKSRVEDILLRGLKWSTLLDAKKKGQWWVSGNISSTADNVEEVASNIDKEVQEAQKLLQLASEQRMNTDARRSIFCIIMSGEDYIDTFEKILRLDLPGKQDREIMRVLVECCLQEKVFNKYYSVLACKLCSHDKNHKFTLQYCLWDHFKELESMEINRSMNLAKFVTEILASFSLSLAVLKSVDLSDPEQMTAKRIMHFRMMFEAIFEKPDKLVWNIFTRIAAAPELETLRNGLEFFIKQYVVSSNKSSTPKFKIAKKALANIEGVLM